MSFKPALMPKHLMRRFLSVSAQNHTGRIPRADRSRLCARAVSRRPAFASHASVFVTHRFEASWWESNLTAGIWVQFKQHKGTNGMSTRLEEARNGNGSMQDIVRFDQTLLVLNTSNLHRVSLHGPVHSSLTQTSQRPWTAARSATLAAALNLTVVPPVAPGTQYIGALFGIPHHGSPGRASFNQFIYITRAWSYNSTPKVSLRAEPDHAVVAIGSGRPARTSSTGEQECIA
ncbi:hypothetical protein C8F04DRAFT_1173573 [Mycena alexandri]|uniref:Uncharacterized protein n=1 Tax=Mycena alexandri TaxID=1745969 RepID=A0AAD6XAT1_9AGAR|nr:hypothetical protein C8F04DRAFT_1173573 [Mycena alexandri]